MGKYIVAMANQFIDSRLHKNQNTARQDLLHRFWIRPDFAIHFAITIFAFLYGLLKKNINFILGFYNIGFSPEMF